MDKQIEDIATEIIENSIKRTAIAFAKWINKEGYREYDESNRWISIEKSHTVYTTEQLYNSFIAIPKNKKGLASTNP